MSEYLQNSTYKQEILKKLITDLHNGRDFEEVKKEFGELVEDVDASEIASMEQQLIAEGMDPEKITKLCDVHAALFKETLSRQEPPELIPGHPLHTLKHENNQAKSLLSKIERDIQNLLKSDVGSDRSVLIIPLRESATKYSIHLDRHFSKKENIFFPYLEKHNITGPPSVMWSVDDEIRDLVKSFVRLLSNLEQKKTDEQLTEIEQSFIKAKDKSLDMFFKEEEILSPMMKNVLSEQEWIEIKEQSEDFGVVFSKPEQDLWRPAKVEKDPEETESNPSVFPLDVGRLTANQVNSILTNLPVDITFVDQNDEVAYFSLGTERIFTRTKAIIGRKVQNCHPPESVHVVEKIVSDFRSGKQSTAQFWLELNGRFIYISYVAIRDTEGTYMGTMEVSQDITELKALKGERRLLHYSE